MKSFFLPNEAATLEFGAKIITSLRVGDIVKITGELGAGKTTLVRGIVQAFGGNPDLVHSPTFSLVHEYECPTISINHCDFYRLEPNSMLPEFGGLEFFDEEKLFLIEWPERIGLFQSITPSRLKTVHLQHDANGRIVNLSSNFQNLD